MRQTLLRIPIDGPWSLGSFEFPGFGFGVVLLVWAVLGAVWLYRHRLELRDPKLLAVPVGVWVAVACAIVMAPGLVQRKADAAIAQADQALAVEPDSTQALMLRLPRLLWKAANTPWQSRISKPS